MSRRKRYRTRNKSVVVADKKPEQHVARDGFINTLAYLGEASALQGANDYERHSITRNWELLTVMYRENWIAKKIIDTPAEDMTRAWYSISSELEQDKIDELMKLEAKHSVKQEITNAVRWSRLYGGSAAVIVIKGQEDMLDQPLDFDTLMPGCFRGLLVLDRTKDLFPSIELEEDMNDPEFGYPMYYQVTMDMDGTESTVRIHHSRLLIFRGRLLPIQEEINEEYWGASEIEHIYEELQKRNATSANIAQLVFQANVSALKIADYGEVIGMGSEKQKEQVYQAIEYMNRIRNSFGMMLMGAEDNFEQHPYSFAGIAEVYESFMLDMAGAAEIPATKLYGRAPQGMNATGESDMKNYYEMIAGLQEKVLRPAIEKLLPVMAMSLWGMIPEDMEIVFEPLETTTPAERAQITQQAAGAIVQAFSAGIISQRTALLELQETGKAIGAWTSITDEDIENAEEEPETGEAGGDPMGMGMGPEGMPQEGQEQPPEMPGGQEPGQETEAPEGAEMGQPEAQPAQDDFSDFREAFSKAVEDGEYERARRMIKVYKRLRRPDAADEESEETEEKRPGLLKRAMRRVLKAFGRDDWEENDHPRGKGGKFVSKGSGSVSSGSGNAESKSEPINLKGLSEKNKPDTPQRPNVEKHEETLRDPQLTGADPESNNKSVHGWSRLKADVEVDGPKQSRSFVSEYLKRNPDVKKEIPKYMHVRDLVQNFTKRFPHAENFNTYDATTGQKLDIQDGFCVTFHQNLTDSDTLGAYSDEDYAAMCAIAKKELGSDSVNIGYFGNPEVSFVCKDEKKAKEFAVKHNQNSVYNASTGKTLKNKKWNPETNPIRL